MEQSSISYGLCRRGQIALEEERVNYFITVEIEINHNCNLSCPYCPNSLSKRVESGMMSPLFFEKIMQQLKEMDYKGKILYHFYNEPLLHPRLAELVSISKKILPDSKSEIYTNGIYLNLKKITELKNAGVDKFTVTKHLGVNYEALEKVWSNLEEKETVRIMDHTELIYTNRGGVVNYGKELSDNLQKRPCYIPTSTTIITLDGNVLGCYEDYHQKNIMGNMQAEHIKDIWLNEKYTMFRNDLKNGKRLKYEVCKTCNNRLLF